MLGRAEPICSPQMSINAVLKPIIDINKCVGCAKCASKCPRKCISIVNDKAQIDVNLCAGCSVCADICPKNAVIMVEDAQNLAKPPFAPQFSPPKSLLKYSSGSTIGRASWSIVRYAITVIASKLREGLRVRRNRSSFAQKQCAGGRTTKRKRFRRGL